MTTMNQSETSIERMQRAVAFLKLEGWSRGDIAAEVTRRGVELSEGNINEMHRAPEDLRCAAKGGNVWDERCRAIAALAAEYIMKQGRYGLRLEKKSRNFRFFHPPQTGGPREQRIVQLQRHRARETALVVEEETGHAVARQERAEAALLELSVQLLDVLDHRSVRVESSRYVIVQMHYVFDIRGIDVARLSPTILIEVAAVVRAAVADGRASYTPDDLATGVLDALLGDAGYTLAVCGFALLDEPMAREGFTLIADAARRQPNGTPFGRDSLTTQIGNMLLTCDRAADPTNGSDATVPDLMATVEAVATARRGNETQKAHEVVCVPADPAQPIAPHLAGWCRRNRWADRLRTALVPAAILLAVVGLLLIAPAVAQAGLGVH